MSDVDLMIECAAMKILGVEHEFYSGMDESERAFAEAVAMRALLSLGLPLKTLAALKAGAGKDINAENGN